MLSTVVDSLATAASLGHRFFVIKNYLSRGADQRNKRESEPRCLITMTSLCDRIPAYEQRWFKDVISMYDAESYMCT